MNTFYKTLAGDSKQVYTEVRFRTIKGGLKVQVSGIEYNRPYGASYMLPPTWDYRWFDFVQDIKTIFNATDISNAQYINNGIITEASLAGTGKGYVVARVRVDEESNLKFQITFAGHKDKANRSYGWSGLVPKENSIVELIRLVDDLIS